MKNSMDFFTRTFQTGIYEKMIQAAEDTNLIQVLEEMQTKQGVEADAAKNNAKLCIAAVASCESVYDSALEDRQAVINHISIKSNINKCVYSSAFITGLFDCRLKVFYGNNVFSP